MTFLILFLAMILGGITGVFLFAQVLQIKHTKQPKAVAGMIIWLLITVVLAVVFLMIYPYGDIGFAVGLLFGLGCDLYRPSDQKDKKQEK